ncbi:MAG: ABC transporter ATP-binding protein, partial [Bacteroidia bacterium]|nr:ABC transporter ATP-binding protein [Bacteroidia bacterium]
LIPKTSGLIEFNGRDITRMQTRDIVSEGVVLCPEGRRVFPDLTVEENMTMGAFLRKDKEGIQRDTQWVYDLFPRLLERKWQLAGTLSGGEQQMLAVGRALMSKPKLLMMDEPSLGLAPLVVKSIFEIIQEINRAGVNVLLIEQNAKAALEISDYAYVLETGVVTLSGTGKELLGNDKVRAAYLGE